MNWNESTINPKVILGYYDSAPSLEHVEIHRISLMRDGPMAEITFDVGSFPERPSRKWPPGANTCQITVRAFGLIEAELTRWSNQSSGTLNVGVVQGGIEIAFSGESKFRLLCSHLDVAGVTGYVNDA